jgi:DNA-3-methyladenine glycosylase
MLNFVTEEQGFPAAVLIRALQPREGLERIAARRNGQPPTHWTDGPAKICRALDIDGRLNGSDLCVPQAVLFVEEGALIPDSAVTTGPRVGLNNVPEPWKSIPWRFLVKRDYFTTESAESKE